jgi:hypothetical protein
VQTADALSMDFTIVKVFETGTLVSVARALFDAW